MADDYDCNTANGYDLEAKGSDVSLMAQHLLPDEATPAVTHCAPRKRRCDEVVEDIADEEIPRPLLHNQRSAKRQRLSRSTTPNIRDVSRQNRLKERLTGHSFADVHVGGQGRVQNGDHIADQITNNHYYGVTATMRVQVPSGLGANDDDDADVRLAATKLVVTAMRTVGTFFVFFQHAMHRAMASLPMQVSCQQISFEDAFGQCKTFDVGLILDWDTFHFGIAQAFRNRPGHERVSHAQYRLFDRHRPQDLIDPKRPPAFSAIFQPGSYLQMSIHFNWDDLVYEPCTHCGLVQACAVGTDSKCSGCMSVFRAFAGDVRLEELQSDSEDDLRNDDYEASTRRSSRIPTPTPGKPQRRQQDTAAAFSRISVTTRPTADKTSGPDDHPHSRIEHEARRRQLRGEREGPWDHRQVGVDDYTVSHFKRERSLGERKQQPFGRSPIGGGNDGFFSPWPSAGSGNVWGTRSIGNGVFDSASHRQVGVDDYTVSHFKRERSPGERKQQPFGRSPIGGGNDGFFSPWPSAGSGNVWGTRSIGN